MFRAGHSPINWKAIPQRVDRSNHGFWTFGFWRLVCISIFAAWVEGQFSSFAIDILYPKNKMHARKMSQTVALSPGNPKILLGQVRSSVLESTGHQIRNRSVRRYAPLSDTHPYSPCWFILYPHKIVGYPNLKKKSGISPLLVHTISPFYPYYIHIYRSSCCFNPNSSFSQPHR